MKKKWIIILAVIVIVVIAISMLHKDKSIDNSVSFGTYIEEDANYGYEIKVNVNRFSNDDFSDQMFQLFDEEWGENYENMSPEEKLVHSGGRFYGSCYQNFDTWSECEAFVGIETYNPLEECQLLIKGDYGTGLSLTDDQLYAFAYPERHHTQVHFRIDQEGNIDFVSMQAGYYQDDIRITLTANRYGKTMETCDAASISTEPITQSHKEVIMPSGNKVIVVEEESEKFSSSNLYFAENDILYMIRVIGDVNQKDKVHDKANEMLDLYSK